MAGAPAAPPGPPGRAVGLTWVERALRSHYGPVAAGVLLLLVVNELSLFGRALVSWDWLLVSGTVLFVAVYPASLSLPERVDAALVRLAAGRALTGSGSGPADVRVLADRLHARARRAALRSGGVAALALLLGWVWAKQAGVVQHLPLVLPQLGGAYLAGMFVGRAMSYGRLGHHLAVAGLDVQVRPGHLDGAAGLRPVGELFLFHATLIAVIGVYLGLWWIAIPQLGAYAEWRDPYAALVVLVVGWEVLAFLLPLWWFHRHMAAQKRELLAHADAHGREVVELQGQWLRAQDDDERSALDARISHLTKRYHDIEGMPTWPLDTRVRRRFAVNNLAVFLPVLVKLAGAPESWQDLGSALTDAISGAG